MTLTGKKLIVTGGASGMGAATVRAFARAGANVASLDVADQEGASVAEAAQAASEAQVFYRHCDVASWDATHRAFEEVCGRLGGLDGLAHFAGVEGYAAAEKTDDALWTRCLT